MNDGKRLRMSVIGEIERRARRFLFWADWEVRTGTGEMSIFLVDGWDESLLILNKPFRESGPGFGISLGVTYIFRKYSVAGEKCRQRFPPTLSPIP